MRTTVITKIETKLDDLEFGYWDEEAQTFVGVERNHQEVQDKFNLSDDAISSLTMFLADVKELIASDLADIWERLDEIDKRLDN